MNDKFAIYAFINMEANNKRNSWEQIHSGYLWGVGQLGSTNWYLSLLSADTLIWEIIYNIW